MGVLELLAVGTLVFSSSDTTAMQQYAQISQADPKVEYTQAGTTKQTSKKEPPKETPKSVPQRKAWWKRNIDVGLGSGKNSVFYVGVMGTSYTEDTTNLPPSLEPSFGIGARALFGWRNSNKGGLNFYGIGLGGERYIGQTPIRAIFGGGIYSPDSQEEQISTNPFIILETTARIKNRKVNLGFIYNEGSRVEAGLRFSL